MSARRSLLWLIPPTIIAIFISLWVGGEPLALSELAQEGSVARRILFELRIPRLVLVLIAGAGFAMLGGTYQVLFHNALAEPYVLGVSSAITLGIASAEIIFKLPSHSVAGLSAGFVSAGLATSLLFMLSRQEGLDVMDRIVLFGMGLNFVLSAFLFLLLSYVSQHMGGGTMRWLFGHIPWISGSEALRLIAMALPLAFLLWLQGRHLDALSLGDGVAKTLGVLPSSARPRILATSSALLAVIVTITGSVGFVGLVMPHAARLLFRPASTRVLFMQSALLGALFLSLSDWASRALLPPMEFPIGILTTLIGGPLFLWILWKR